MLVKTSELKGKPLNWAVAKCEGRLGSDRVYISNSCTIAEGVLPAGVLIAPESAFDIDVGCLHYDSDWGQGGPIIERENITPSIARNREFFVAWKGCASDFGLVFHYKGATPLIAAMRCYVASKMGDEIEIPDEFEAAP